MMVMTAKVNMKKVIIALVAVAALILGLVLLFGGGSKDAATTAVTGVTGNDARVEFLKGFGWDVNTSPTESGQVRIPEESSEVFDRYNALQKSQGYDLTQYAGKNVMRYVYKVNNFPGATQPVYATILVYKNQVIGGDITDTGPKGVIQGFKMQGGSTEQSTPVTQPEESTAVTE